MIEPPSPPSPWRAAIRRAASWPARKQPFRLVSSTESQSSTVTSRNGLVTAMPALFTRMSTTPSSASVASKAAETEPGSVTSMATAAAVPAGGLDLGLQGFQLAGLTGGQGHLRAGLGQGLGEAGPSPWLAPVTRAVLPVRSKRLAMDGLSSVEMLADS